MWKRYKPTITKLVMWSVKNHWLLLVVAIGAQYLIGKAMVNPNLDIPLSYDNLLSIHSWLGNLILVVAVFLGIEKIYLWLLRRGTI